MSPCDNLILALYAKIFLFELAGPCLWHLYGPCSAFFSSYDKSSIIQLSYFSLITESIHHDGRNKTTKIFCFLLIYYIPTGLRDVTFKSGHKKICLLGFQPG